MDIQILLGIQIVADIVLCAAIVVLLRRSAAGMKQRSAGAADQDLKQLRDMLDESQQAAARFLECVEESRKSLRGLFYQLEERERTLRELLRTGETPPVSKDPSAKTDGKSAASPSDRYGEVIALHKRGMSGSDIARQSGLPEGEISLILDLERAKGDSPAGNRKIAKT